MTIRERVLTFGNRFVDRLDESIISDAMSYVEHNEIPLAFEILCDQVYEYAVRIESAEYDELKEIAAAVSLSSKSVDKIKELVASSGEGFTS
jgi:hypothetical protein